MAQERVRMEDVAKHAGVSTATVSRVLSRPDIVKTVRRDAVLNAIKRLGYVPDQSARALASGRTYTVGCVVPSIDHAIFAKSTQSLQTTLLKSGYQLLIASHDYDAQTEYNAVLALQQRGVDALVLVGTDHLPTTWKAIKSWGKPVLLNWSCDPRLPSIGFDNHAVASALTEHLLGLGHRNIGLISGLTLHNDRARTRIAGVRDAMNAAGLLLKATHITEQPFSLAGGRLGLQTLMRLKRRPTAIICGNDLLAAGALLEAQRMGMCVPQELSICGIDNQELSRELIPRLTTVNLPTEDLGRITANQIIAALSGEKLPKQRLLPFELLVRESTAPAIDSREQ
jgi:LacI family transcriptional regulator